MKLCSNCKTLKEDIAFAKDNGKKDGLHSACRSCTGDYMKQYYQAHRDIIIDRERRFYQANKNAIRGKTAERRKKNGHIWNENRRKKKMENPVPTLLSSAKVRAKKQGLDFDISEVDVFIPKTCPVLGIPLFVSTKKAYDNSPTLDRIDNTKGYIKGNVLVVSYKANTIKSNATVVELEKVANFYRSIN